MANLTPDAIRGFLAPFRFTSDNFWSSESTLSQNGELSGVPVALNRTSLKLVAKGSQSQEVDIKTIRGGHIQDGAGYSWKYASDSDYYGMETPNKLFDTSLLQSPSINQSYIPRDSIKLSSGSVLISVEFTNITENRIYVSKISSDGIYSLKLIDTKDISGLVGNKRFPALCKMNDDSVLLYFWAIDDSKSLANIFCYRSVDDGETWTQISSRCILEDIDISSTFGSGNPGNKLQKITVAANSHQVLLLASLDLHDTTSPNQSYVIQYGSVNRGVSFQLIAESTNSTRFYTPDLVVWNDIFIASYINSTDSLKVINIGNAFDSIFAKSAIITPQNISGTFATGGGGSILEDGDKTMFIDSDGRIYLYVVNVNKYIVYGAYSDLAGVGVSEYGYKWKFWSDTITFNNSRALDFGSSGGIKNIVGVPGQGDNLLFHNWSAAGTNSFKDGLLMSTLGGYGTQQYPKLQPYPEDNQWAYNSRDYAPFDLPGVGSVWTKTASGSPLEILRGDSLGLQAALSDTIKYSNTISDKSNGVILHTKIKDISGGSSSRGVAFGVQIQPQSTGVVNYHFEIVLNGASIYVYDVHAGYTTPIASAININLNPLELLVHFDNSTGDLLVYYCDGSSPRQFSVLSSSLTTAAAFTQEIYWGIPTSNGGTREGDYQFFSYSLGSKAGLQWVEGQITPRQYSARGFWSPIKDGLSISSIDGPAREGDHYSISPQYNSPIERVLHVVSPSPDIGWRSDKVADPDLTAIASQEIAWVMDTTLLDSVNTHISSEAVGVHLTNINFKSFTVQKYNAISSRWETLATVDNTIGGGFAFSRLGAALVSTAATGPYLHLNEAQDWSVLLDDGAGTIVQRRIESSGDGVLSGTTSTKKAYLHLKGVKSGDPVSGTCYLIPSSCTVIIDENEFAGIRLVIGSQKTAEGYFEIGTMVMGPIVITSPQYGRGRSVSFEANIIENQQDNGTLFSSRRGNSGRLVRLSWTDGVDTSQLNEAAASPSYYELFTGSPIAAMGSAPSSMMGLINYLDGSVNALVYLPRLETGSPSSLVFNRYHNHILGTLGTDVAIEHVIGDELESDNRGEVFRISTMIFREVR